VRHAVRHFDSLTANIPIHNSDNGNGNDNGNTNDIVCGLNNNVVRAHARFHGLIGDNNGNGREASRVAVVVVVVVIVHGFRNANTNTDARCRTGQSPHRPYFDTPGEITLSLRHQRISKRTILVS